MGETNEQTAAKCLDEVQRLQEAYVEAKNNFNDSRAANAERDVQVKLFRKLHEASTTVFNAVDKCIVQSDLLGANHTDFWAKDLANTAVDTLTHIAYRYERLWENADRLGMERPKPGDNAFFAMQSSAKLYYPHKAETVKKVFKDLGLPTAGFDETVVPKQLDKPVVKTPPWFPVAGVVLAGATLFFFMGLVIAGVAQHEVPADSRFLVVCVLALGAALGGSFLGGSAAAKGEIPLPFAKNHPVAFTASGGIAVLIIVLILGNFFYVRGADTPERGVTFDIVSADQSANAQSISQQSNTLLGTMSGVERADLRVGPFTKDTEIWLTASNTAERVFENGFVGVKILGGEELLVERQMAGEGTVSCSVAVKLRIHARKQLRFEARGWNWHAFSKQVTISAYRPASQ